MQKKKIAVLGLGGIARKAYLPILGVDKNLELFLYNRSAAALQEIQSQYHITAGSTQIDDVIAAQPGAAFVLTSSPSHYDIATRLLQAGIDVYLEKPATMHSKETRQLAELAERQNCVLMVGFNRRFAPLHVRARELWGDRPPGLAVFSKFRSSSSYNTLEEQLIEDTIHQIDVLRFYCGEGHARTCTIKKSGGFMESVSAAIELESGGIAVVQTNFQAGQWQEHYALYGSGQTLELQAFSLLRFNRHGENRCWQEGYDSSWETTLDGRGFSDQIAHFFDCLESRQTPQTSGRDSVKTQLLLEEIVRLAESQNS